MIITSALLAANLALAGGPLPPTLYLNSTTPPLNQSNVDPTAPIILEFTSPLNLATITDDSLRVFGRWSGAVPGQLFIAKDAMTLFYNPSRAFTAGDTITVCLSEAIESQAGEPFAPGGYTFSFFTAAGQADMDFKEIAQYEPDSQFVRIYGGQMSDLDADGWLDLSIVNENSDDVRVYMNNDDGSGLFTGPIKPYAPVGSTPSPNEPADFNNDGHVDIVVANTQDTTISVLLGNGDGTFQPATHYENGFSGRGIAVLDFDGDGDTDIAATAASSNYMRLFANQGDGTFIPRDPIELGAEERALAAADMNNDAIADLVLSLFDSDSIVVMLGNGNGTFTPLPPAPAGGSVWMISIADINNDGNVDLSTANGPDATGSILLGDGAGGLSAPLIVPAGGFCTATDLGDLDGDGDPDWVLSAFGGGQWRLYENNTPHDGDAAFELHTVFPAVSNPGCSLMADIDNDSDLDLILLDELADIIHIMQNTSTPGGCPADLTGDGQIDSTDLNIILAAFGTSDAGDTDGDGDTDSADLNTVLAKFGAGCP